MNDRAEFEGVLEARSDALCTSHIIALPHNAADTWLVTGANFRIVITLQGVASRRALFRNASGGHYVLVGNALVKQLGLRAGQLLPVRIEPDPDPTAVDVPDELEAGMAWEPRARAVFAALPPGKQRWLCQQVDTAKTDATRVKRAAQTVQRL
jgi:Bacteriocin-protection, YdeI or OmpD-Associated/Domain of unknown function (DUF1905)